MPGMSQTASLTPAFAPVAQRVQVWVVLRRWLALLRMTLIPASLVLVLFVLAALRGSGTWFSPWMGLIVWLAGGLGYFQFVVKPVLKLLVCDCNCQP